MSKKVYRLTDRASAEMRRAAPNGEITLSDRAARFELRRGTIEGGELAVAKRPDKPAAK